MLVSEEQVAALEAQVAELLGILELLDEDGAAEGVRRYAEQVGCIGLAAGNAGFLGLREVCRLFHEHLADLGSRGRDLIDAERERLEEWPILVIGYLGDPTDPAASEPLIDHLSSPVWSTPVAAEQAGALCASLAGGTLVAEPQPSPPAETVAEKQADIAMEAMEASPIPAAASAEPVLAFQPPAAVEATEPSLTEPVRTEPFIVEIPASARTFEHLTETVSEAASETEAKVVAGTEPDRKSVV